MIAASSGSKLDKEEGDVCLAVVSAVKELECCATLVLDDDKENRDQDDLILLPVGCRFGDNILLWIDDGGDNA
jgi:hypothetical protein